MLCVVNSHWIHFHLIWCYSIDSINWECVNHRNNTFWGLHPILASYFSHILLRRTSIRSFLICLVAFKRHKASSFVIIVFIRAYTIIPWQRYEFISISARKSRKKWWYCLVGGVWRVWEVWMVWTVWEVNGLTKTVKTSLFLSHPSNSFLKRTLIL